MAGQKVKQAEGLLDLNLEYFPDSYTSYFFLGELKRFQGLNDEAIQAYQKALEINPDMPPVISRLKLLSDQGS